MEGSCGSSFLCGSPGWEYPRRGSGPNVRYQTANSSRTVFSKAQVCVFEELYITCEVSPPELPPHHLTISQPTATATATATTTISQLLNSSSQSNIFHNEVLNDPHAFDCSPGIVQARRQLHRWPGRQCSGQCRARGPRPWLQDHQRTSW